MAGGSSAGLTSSSCCAREAASTAPLAASDLVSTSSRSCADSGARRIALLGRPNKAPKPSRSSSLDVPSRGRHTTTFLRRGSSLLVDVAGLAEVARDSVGLRCGSSPTRRAETETLSRLPCPRGEGADQGKKERGLSRARWNEGADACKVVRREGSDWCG